MERILSLKINIAFRNIYSRQILLYDAKYLKFNNECKWRENQISLH